MKTFLIILSWISNLFPNRFLLALGEGMGWIWFNGIRFRRQIVIENLHVAFGREKTASEIEALALENFKHYGKAFWEIIRTASWKEKDFHSNIQVSGFENISKYLAERKPVILLSLHSGSWELAVLTTAALGVPLDLVVKRSQVSAVDNFLLWYRTKTGARILYETGTAKDILKSLSKGRFVTFILDQFMGPPIGLPVQFFGKRAGTAAALSLIVERHNVPVIPAFSYRDTEGKVNVVYGKEVTYPLLSEEKETRLFERTQAYNDVLESIIRKHPEQWLWLHRRWKAFNGVSRWQLRNMAASSSAIFLFLILGCAHRQATPTGIEIPTDPTIQPIKSSDVKDEKEITEESKLEEDPKPEVLEEKSLPAKKKKIKKMEATMEPPAPPSSSSANIPPPIIFEKIKKERIGFEIGERLQIDLRWMAIPAGRATIEVREGPEIGSRKTFHFWGNVLSSKIADAIYHIDNTIESFVDEETFVPYKFLLHMLETHQKKETRVIFDHEHSQASYWAKRISQKWGNENSDRIDPLTPKAKDMFTALYYARTLSYQLNKKESFFVYENKQNLRIDLEPVANELVIAKTGAFQCWKIRVFVTLNNMLKQTGDMFIWLSDDSKKYMVKFDAKVKIGSVVGELVSIRDR